MKAARLLAVPLIALSALFVSPAATPAAVTYSLIVTIPVPGNPLNSFDISWVDPTTRTYYLADRSNAAVDVFATLTNAFAGRVTGFVGFRGSNDISGPDGVLVAQPLKQLWATDGDSTAKVFDLGSGQLLATISTGGQFRVDELAFDPRDNLILAANPDDDVPFLSFISATNFTVLSKIPFPNATDGLEQPVWDPETARFYQAVPEIGGDPLSGGIAVINPITQSVEQIFPVSNCHQHGLALGPNHALLLGCSGDAIAAGAPPQSIVMDKRNGAIVAVIPQVGGSDEVWFNPGDNRYYLAANKMVGGPVLGVIDALTNTWLANVPTGPIAHSVAVDPFTNQVYVPVAGEGVRVYAAQQ